MTVFDCELCEDCMCIDCTNREKSTCCDGEDACERCRNMHLIIACPSYRKEI